MIGKRDDGKRKEGQQRGREDGLTGTKKGGSG